uniref:Transcription factor bHLH96-like isoform X2 n=1 Tax=Cymbidium ensifolium TaxID=78740 RepID=A0A515HFW7_CYMEN|nr:transcription factor bHLH96-like isoform X2 [Cymbidium ensifolium]
MSFEMLSSSFIVYDDISATTEVRHQHSPSFLFDSAGGCLSPESSMISSLPPPAAPQPPPFPPSAGSQGKRKRRRRPRSCKNKEEAETQRMTHIAVERNRRRQMNEHLAMLRSLMPESYIQRGDQASIVGGAIDFVKELEHLLQSLEAQKRTIEQTQKASASINDSRSGLRGSNDETEQPPFAQFFAYPQYNWCHPRHEYPSPAPENLSPAVADIEVTLIETHANLRILSPTRPRQLIQLVAGLQALRLSILHLNVTTLDSMVLYSLSVKVEDGCSLTTVDEIAAAVHHMLSLIAAGTVPAVDQVLPDGLEGSPRLPLSFE